jgi:hypothetical protein
MAMSLVLTRIPFLSKNVRTGWAIFNQNGHEVMVHKDSIYRMELKEFDFVIRSCPDEYFGGQIDMAILIEPSEEKEKPKKETWDDVVYDYLSVNPTLIPSEFIKYLEENYKTPKKIRCC